jgi:hypothetical protein
LTAGLGQDLATPMVLDDSDSKCGRRQPQYSCFVGPVFRIWYPTNRNLSAAAPNHGLPYSHSSACPSAALNPEAGQLPVANSRKKKNNVKSSGISLLPKLPPMLHLSSHFTKSD